MRSEILQKILDETPPEIRAKVEEIAEQMRRNWKVEKLLAGETFIASEKGNSMVPLIRSGQDHELSPATWEQVKVGDIVFCKVAGRHYTHLVKAIDPHRGCQIGNNHGRINGWTKTVYGKVTRVI